MLILSVISLEGASGGVAHVLHLRENEKSEMKKKTKQYHYNQETVGVSSGLIHVSIGNIITVELFICFFFILRF